MKMGLSMIAAFFFLSVPSGLAQDVLGPTDSDNQFQAISIMAERMQRAAPTLDRLPVFSVDDADLSITQMVVNYYPDSDTAHHLMEARGVANIPHRRVLPNIALAWSMAFIPSTTDILSVGQSVIDGEFMSVESGATYFAGVLSEWWVGDENDQFYYTKLTVFSTHAFKEQAVLAGEALALTFSNDATAYLASHSVTPPASTDTGFIAVPSFRPGRSAGILPASSVTCSIVASDVLFGPAASFDLEITPLTILTICETGNPGWSVKLVQEGIIDVWICRLEARIVTQVATHITGPPDGLPGNRWCMTVEWEVCEMYGIFVARIVRQCVSFVCEKRVCCCPE